MRPGFVLILVSVLIFAAGVGIYLYFFHEKSNISGTFQIVDRKSPVPSGSDESYSVGTRKNTTPNDTSRWIYFGSELYKYSLKYPNNFKIIVGNKNVFQANSKDYLEENGVVKAGAITQVIASETTDSFEDAWGSIDKSLKNLGIKILSKEESTVEGESAYKFRLEHDDGTTEIRYLTYKSPYSFKISIVVGKNSQSQMDDYEQILDDITSTFKF